MNAAVVRARILAIRAELDELLEQVDTDAAPTAASATSPWRTMQEYADYAHVSYDTVRGWVRKGLPHIGDGKLTRIHLEQADAWRRERKG